MVLNKIWPQAPLYTAVYNPKTAPWAKQFRVKPSFLQKIPGAQSHHEWLAWLTPLAFESFDFSQFNVVISLTSAEAKGIITPPSVLHICYCLTPTRYLWSGKNLYENQGLRSWGLKLWGPYLRQWDQVAAQRPDMIVAISQTVQARIKKYYRRDSQVIYPPVDTKIFKNPQSIKVKKLSPAPFYLLVSRLVIYKQVAQAIDAFNRLPQKRLIIVGEGEEKARLQAMAGHNINFVGQLTDGELVSYYQSCQAVIFPGEEDFGLVAVEAAALGKPVIAYGKGGVAETVIHGQTGWLYAEQTASALKQAIVNFEKRRFKSSQCRQQALKFSEQRFIKQFKNFVEAAWKRYRRG